MGTVGLNFFFLHKYEGHYRLRLVEKSSHITAPSVSVPLHVMISIPLSHCIC